MNTKRNNDQVQESATRNRRSQDLSSELYRDYSEHMDMPIDSDMPLDVRYELYISKVVYLKNLLGQCFHSVNKQMNGSRTEFSADDFVNLQRSFIVTRDLIRDCVLKRFSESLARHAHAFSADSGHDQQSV